MSLAKHRELEHYHFDYSKCISPERWPARLEYLRERGERKTFTVKDVPLWVWRKYWLRRIEVTKEALANLKAVSKGDIARAKEVK